MQEVNSKVGDDPTFYVMGFSLLFFETGSCYTPQTGLKLGLLLPWPPGHWDYMLGIYMGAGIQTPALTLVWQVLYQLGYGLALCCFVF